MTRTMVTQARWLLTQLLDRLAEDDPMADLSRYRESAAMVSLMLGDTITGAVAELLDRLRHAIKEWEEVQARAGRVLGAH